MSTETLYKKFVAENGARITQAEFERITKVNYGGTKAEINDAYFEMYSKGLGGKLERADYDKIRAKFIVDTTPAFVGGEGDRMTAERRFTKWLRSNPVGESFARIFSSVDLVTPYA